MDIELIKNQAKIDVVISILKSIPISDFSDLKGLDEIMSMIAPEKKKMTTKDLFDSWIVYKNKVKMNNGWIFKLNAFNTVPSFDDRCKNDGCVNCSITIEPRIVGATAEHWIERGVLGESNQEHINLNHCRISELQVIIDWMAVNDSRAFIARRR
jgi:hypothetical protein